MYDNSDLQVNTKKKPEPPERLRAFLGGFFCCAVLAFVLWFVLNRYTGKEAEIRRLIKNRYLEEVSYEDITAGKYRGMIAATGDRYSAYYTKEEYEETKKTNRGVYTGVGIVFSTDAETGDITIAEVYPGSPAEREGLLMGDSVVEIDGVRPPELKISDVAAALRSGEKKAITITVTREGETEPVTVTVAAEEVDIKTVGYELKEDGTGYIAISNFRESTEEHFKEALNDLREQGMERLIIDLRNNGGGLVASTANILSTFVPEGLLVYTVEKDGTRKEYTSNCKEPLEVPLAVLVNGDTVSAAEIFAGAVKDRKTGIIVGEQTFGKGIVQTFLGLLDGSAVKLTTAYYYTPDGININGTGITPDIAVSMPEDGIMDTGEKDAQYQAALKALKEGS